MASGFAVVPSRKMLMGPYTRPSTVKYQWKEPTKEYVGEGLNPAGKGLRLAGQGAPSIQSIIATEMMKGQGITIDQPSMMSSAPMAGHSSGGALLLAGQRNPKYRGCGSGETLPAQLLKEKLSKMVKRRKNGGSLVFPISGNDKMESREFDSQFSKQSKKRGFGLPSADDVKTKLKSNIANVVLPAIHDAVNLPAFRPEVYKKIVDSVKLKSVDTAKDIKDFAIGLAKAHLPVLVKMAQKKLGKGYKGSGKVIDSKLFNKFLKPMMSSVMSMLKAQINPSGMGGGAMRPKVKQFFKDFAEGFLSVMEPASKVLLPAVATAIGQPELIPFAPLATMGISALRKKIKTL